MKLSGTVVFQVGHAHGLLARVVERESLVFAAIVAVTSPACSLSVPGRLLLGYHETDYLLFFVPDAIRFLAGEPLQSPFHPRSIRC